jgi:hypothetical protein
VVGRYDGLTGRLLIDDVEGIRIEWPGRGGELNPMATESGPAYDYQVRFTLISVLFLGLFLFLFFSSSYARFCQSLLAFATKHSLLYSRMHYIYCLFP